MNNTLVNLVFGSLLHDIGKIVIRGSSEQGTHSQLGMNFVSQLAELADGSGSGFNKEIIEQIRYHHARELTNADISANSLAYITYFADNISAGMDRKDEGLSEGFDSTAKLRKIFNILNGHNDDNTIEHDDYNYIRESIWEGLRRIEVSQRGIGSLLNLLEAYTDKIPSSTNKAQLIDVSLFDHAKTTAAIAACLFEYLLDNNITDYRAALFNQQKSQQYYQHQVFLLWSCDMSGIQDFIYNISGEKALKQLRARSLYLEMMLEHVADELLERLQLSRCNLLYSGGGHLWALLPNTQRTREALDRFTAELKAWCLKAFRTDLFFASACIACSGDDLANGNFCGEGQGVGRYRSIFAELGAQLSAAKAQRYSAQEISALNFSTNQDTKHTRECRECNRSDTQLDGDRLCSICSALARISPALAQKDVFVVAKTGDLELPFAAWLSVWDAQEYLAKKPDTIRIYSKNEWHTGLDLATHIWMGDYKYIDEQGGDFEFYSKHGATLADDKGIERLGVLRADVDNLGAVFSHGLPDNKISISRTATLSRALSYFFKFKINEILRAGYQDKGAYRVQIIYSGGDDLFIVGNWSDVLYAALAIKKALDEFTGNGVLTISAGVGLYAAHYPLARMATETGELEAAAKSYKNDPNSSFPSKNAVAIWSTDRVFSWDEVEEEIRPKLYDITQVFDKNEKGKSFIYRLIELLRSTNDPISIPRLAYLLARSFEDDKAEGRKTSKRFFQWATDEKQRGYLTAALEWYVYSIREKG